MMPVSEESDDSQTNDDLKNNCTEASTSSNKKQNLLNIESHYFEIVHHNTLHGPFYPAKRAIEDFMEREEWNEDEKQKWNFLCAETIVVLAKDEADIPKKIESSLFSTRHNLLLVPRVYYVVRIYFDTSLVPRKSITLNKSRSFEKDFKLMNKRYKSLPEGKNSNYNSIDSAKVHRSISCILI